LLIYTLICLCFSDVRIFCFSIVFVICFCFVCKELQLIKLTYKVILVFCANHGYYCQLVKLSIIKLIS
jgi:uncharacterized membrane protein YagU involved in acid resistance